jgi:glucose/arabinose dehydrogenase
VARNRLRARTAVLGASLSVVLSALTVAGPAGVGPAQAAGPTMLDPRLAVRTVVSGLVTPTSLAFLGADDILVLEKNTGKVQRVAGGQIQSTVLDLAVNFGSERGLLGVALHPNFPQNPSVYLHWTQSSTGQDTGVLSNVPLLGNRVDRFVWVESTRPAARRCPSHRGDPAPQRRRQHTV